MSPRNPITPRGWATIIVIGVLLLAFVTDVGYIEWRNNLVESVPIGATKAEVVAIMGSPEQAGTENFVPGCSAPTKECYEWSVHRNYQYVCFGQDGRVICRGTYTIWV